jgi:hypothetical protein
MLATNLKLPLPRRANNNDYKVQNLLRQITPKPTSQSQLNPAKVILKKSIAIAGRTQSWRAYFMKPATANNDNGAFSAQK